MSDNSVKNDYLEQVQRKQEALEVDLKLNKRAANYAPAAAAPMAMPAQGIAVQQAQAPAPARSRTIRVLPQAEPVSAAVDVRITGWWRWKTVIVPPNAYVVHTRKGSERPLHIGLGISFPYNPY